MFDWTIGLGNILTIIVLGAGGVGFVYTIRGRVDALSGDIVELQKQIARMVDVLIEQARHSERLAAIDQRIAAQGQRLDELTNRFNRIRNGEPG